MLTFNSPFWQFSLSVYAMPGVAAECLDLQGRFDIDVNVLLFCAWMGNAHKVALSQDGLAMLAASVAVWRDKVVRPLRAARQDLKPMPAMENDAVKSLRDDIAKLELRAEQAEQAMLFDLVSQLTGVPMGSAADAARHNVAAFLQDSVPTGAAAAEHLIAAATAYRPD